MLNILEESTDISWTWDEILPRSCPFVVFPHYDKQAGLYKFQEVNFSAGSSSVSLHGLRGNQSLKNACYYWEIVLNMTDSPPACLTLGVALKTDCFRWISCGRKSFGDNKTSWGVTNTLLDRMCRKNDSYGNQMLERSVYGVLFNGIDGSLSYYRDGQYVGTGLLELHKIQEPIYPVMLSQHSVVVALNCVKNVFVSLQDRCRVTATEELGENYFENLVLPSVIKMYLTKPPYGNIIPTSEFERVESAFFPLFLLPRRLKRNSFGRPFFP